MSYEDVGLTRHRQERGRHQGLTADHLPRDSSGKDEVVGDVLEVLEAVVHLLRRLKDVAGGFVEREEDRADLNQLLAEPLLLMLHVSGDLSNRLHRRLNVDHHGRADRMTSGDLVELVGLRHLSTTGKRQLVRQALQFAVQGLCTAAFNPEAPT